MSDKDKNFAEMVGFMDLVFYRNIVEQARDIILVVDEEGEILAANQAAAVAYGYSKNQLCRLRVHDLRDPKTSGIIDNQLKIAQQQGILFRSVHLRRNGEAFPVEVSSQRFDFSDREAVVSIVRDITETVRMETALNKSERKYRLLNEELAAAYEEIAASEEELRQQLDELLMREQENATLMLSYKDELLERRRVEERLKHLSLHDVLTGVYNRDFFEERMKQLQRSRDGFVGLLVCDIDGLKIINDTLGHAMGDLILKQVAQILKDYFNHDDCVARIGGDEFAVLLSSNFQMITDCSGIHEKIKSYNDQNPMVPISLSLGFAVSQQIPIDMDELFKEADNNMYREKLHQQKSARSAIVQALIKALEARDFITEGHGDRLQYLVESFAYALELPQSSIADLRLFAHFHDIGKVGIPDKILFKSAPLTSEEWTIMRQHCEIGYRIAMSTPDLAPIADWILKHHEWWNGSGYFMGIAGEDIPLECRILALADAYDAMTNDRPYRQAMSHQEAIDEILYCAGTQFDPTLAQSFVAMLEMESQI